MLRCMFVSPQSVWGSFWKDGHWGYKCCHQLVKEAYCTGEAGIEAAEVSPYNRACRFLFG